MEENNWDLQAVVRSCAGPNVAPEETRDPFAYFSSSQEVVEDTQLVDANHGDIIVPELSSPGPSVAEDLEELCKPFFRSTSLPATSQPPELQPQRQPSLFFTQPAPQVQRTLSEPTRSKKRKKQQKKVVCQVPVDGFPTDVWAWRKYGQKPIKGSPYPRAYYRCSSSKGCPARKQVERSRTDADVLLITYTADHNHPIPTHRNSLAGSTRHKPNSTSPKVNTEKVNEASTPSSGPAVPADATTPEMEVEEGDLEGGLPLPSTDLGASGGVKDDMLFSALDDPSRPSPSDQFTSIFSSSHWTPSSTTSTAGEIPRPHPSSSA